MPHVACAEVAVYRRGRNQAGNDDVQVLCQQGVRLIERKDSAQYRPDAGHAALALEGRRLPPAAPVHAQGGWAGPLLTLETGLDGPYVTRSGGRRARPSPSHPLIGHSIGWFAVLSRGSQVRKPLIRSARQMAAMRHHPPGPGASAFLRRLPKASWAAQTSCASRSDQSHAEALV